MGVGLSEREEERIVRSWRRAWEGNRVADILEVAEEETAPAIYLNSSRRVTNVLQQSNRKKNRDIMYFNGWIAVS